MHPFPAIVFTCVPLVLLLVVVVRARTLPVEDDCKTLSPGILVDILGPAYNPRYMSIEEPEIESKVDGAGKRAASDVAKAFFVDKDYMRGLGDEPAWEKKSWNETTTTKNCTKSLFFPTNATDQRRRDHQLEDDLDATLPQTRRRQRRAVRQWGCESRVRWMDLGADFFPRYVRSVECAESTCWYGHFHCRARSFTIKILRRRRGRCVYVGRANTLDLVVGGTAEDMRELWVWEERAVNFCCDCAL